jgi:hypothetical protein
MTSKEWFQKFARHYMVPGILKFQQIRGDKTKLDQDDTFWQAVTVRLKS